MSATIRRLRPNTAEANAVRQLRFVLDEMDGLPCDLAERVGTLIDRHERSTSGWHFVMVDPKLFHATVAALLDGPDVRRPKLAVKLFTLLFSKLPDDSNEVTATREELAAELGCRPTDVSQVIGELEKLGAVYRRQEGRGVVYLVHPMFGTHLKGAIRDRAQAEAPQLKLVPSRD